MSAKKSTETPAKKPRGRYFAPEVGTPWEMADVALRLAALNGSVEPDLEAAERFLVAARQSVRTIRVADENEHYRSESELLAIASEFPKPAPHNDAVQAVCRAIGEPATIPISVKGFLSTVFSYDGVNRPNLKRHMTTFSQALKDNGRTVLALDYLIKSKREYFDLVWTVTPYLPGIAKVKKQGKRHNYRDGKTGKMKSRVKSLKGG